MKQGQGLFFLDKTPKAEETKPKINKWDYIKLKRFCIITKETIIISPTYIRWEKIFQILTRSYNSRYKGNLKNSIEKII
jgi:hypothetical protein